MNPEDLLDLWERCSDAPPTTRACLLAGWVSGTGPAEVIDWPLGAVQAGVLDAWRLLAGTPFEAVVGCPACAGTLELLLDPDELPASPPDPPGTLHDHDGSPLTPRLLTPADVQAVAGLDPTAARMELARRALGVPEPSDELQHAAATALEEADSAASWWVELSCSNCGHVWEEPWDLTAFVWHALDEDADRLMHQVAELAAAFGWSEPTVLALPPHRRAVYLERAMT